MNFLSAPGTNQYLTMSELFLLNVIKHVLTVYLETT